MIERTFSSYTVQWSPTFRLVRISVGGRCDFYYWLAPVSRADTPEQCDRTLGWSDPVVEERPASGLRLTFVVQSSCWDRRETVFEFHPDRIETWIRLRGNGPLERVHWFCGVVDDQPVGSVPGFDRYTPGCPNFLGRRDFAPNEAYTIGVGHEPSHFWGQAVNSGPLFYALHKDRIRGCMAAGMVVAPGENLFDGFDFNHKPSDFESAADSIVGPQSFSLSYFGRLEVDGAWESPRLAFVFGRDREMCLRRYCRLLEGRGAIPRKRQTRDPAWWHRPIFCTWHEQCALGRKMLAGQSKDREAMEGGALIKQQCTQANCEHWLDVIMRERLSIGTFMIDAKWQRHYATNEPDLSRWPDLRGFIDRCHGLGMKVILWLDAWLREGLPDDECMRRDSLRIAVDPTHPGYRDRLRASIRQMLSPAGLDADGFKIDGTNRAPMGPGLANDGGLYGYELQHAYLKLYYEAALEAKPDAMVCLYTANPYFRDVCNYLRLGDLYSMYGRPTDAMRERAGLYRIAMPGKGIDTDGAFRFSLAEDPLEEWGTQVELGTPTLYAIEHHLHLRGFHPGVLRAFEAADYERLRRTLDAYGPRRES
ncbi:MAG: hypothetical protein WD468_04445 [Pirellulales bacterium]